MGQQEAAPYDLTLSAGHATIPDVYHILHEVNLKRRVRQ